MGIVDNISQFFDTVFLFFLMAMILVGLPAVILKLVSSLFIMQAAPRSRRTLVGRSLTAGLASGLLAIMVYFAFSSTGNFLPFLAGQLLAGEIYAGLTMLVVMTIADYLSWRAMRVSTGLRRVTEGLIWLGGSNIWIVWALCLMWTFGSFELARPCYDNYARAESAGVDVDACTGDARSYWALHPDLWGAIAH